MTITNAGLVGIGVTAPTARLQVNDTQSGSGALSGISLVETWNTTGNPSAFLLNVINTASGATARLATFQVGGADRMVLDKNGRLTVNSTASNASAQLQVDSTTRGFLPPRVTTTQRNAISTPSAGLEVYDSTLNAPYYYNGTAWVTYGGSGGWLLNGNTVGTTKTLGTIDNFDLPFITNNTEKMRISGAGTLTAQNANSRFEFDSGIRLQPQGSIPLITLGSSFGFAMGDGSAGTISASSSTSMVHGAVNTASSVIITTNTGAVASGANSGTLSSISSDGIGSSARGKISNSTSNSGIVATGDGSRASGNVGGSWAVISAGGIGSTASGKVLVNAPSGSGIFANGDGSLAIGQIDGVTVGNITAAEGAIAAGVISTGANDAYIDAAQGSFAIGRIDGITSGIQTIGYGSGTIGVSSSGAASVITIGNGSLTVGHAIINTAIQTEGMGSFTAAIGEQTSYINRSNGSILIIDGTSNSNISEVGTPSDGGGNAVFGKVANSIFFAGDSSNTGTPTFGNMLQGHATDGAVVETLANGSFTRGRVIGSQASMRTTAGADGSMVSGYVDGTSGPGQMYTQGFGSHVFGVALSGGTLYTSYDAGLVFGFASNSSSIGSGERGSFAVGFSDNGSNITAGEKGALGGGYADNGCGISSLGQGAIAYGHCSTASQIESVGRGSIA